MARTKISTLNLRINPAIKNAVRQAAATAATAARKPPSPVAAVAAAAGWAAPSSTATAW